MTRRGVLSLDARQRWERLMVTRRAVKAAREVAAGKISVNQARARLGLPPFPADECDRIVEGWGKLWRWRGKCRRTRSVRVRPRI